MVRLRLRSRRRRNPEGRMSVLDHLRELRRRVVVILLIIAVGSVVGWIFYDPILTILKHPYCSVPASHRFPPNSKDCELIFTAPLDGFTTRLKVSVIAGAVLTAPLWLYQIWAFITPGLRKNERKHTLMFIAASTLLFAAGVCLAYVVLSKGLQVLIGAAGSGAVATLTVNSYLSFVILMLVIFGASFELPLLIVMANLVGVLPAKLLQEVPARRHLPDLPVRGHSDAQHGPVHDVRHGDPHGAALRGIGVVRRAARPAQGPPEGGGSRAGPRARAR